jgi:hypothetical protein
MRRGNNIDSLLNPSGTGLILMTGVSISAPDPVPPIDTLGPFNAQQAGSMSIFDASHIPALPSQPTQVYGLPAPEHNAGGAGLTGPLENGSTVRWNMDRPRVRPGGNKSGGLQANTPSSTNDDASDVIDSRPWDEALEIWTSSLKIRDRGSVALAVADMFGWGNLFDDIDNSLSLFEREYGNIYLAPPRLAKKYPVSS